MGIPLGLIDLDVPMVWSVEGLLSAQECASIRARADGIEWLEATVNTARGRAIRAEIRDSSTGILRDPELLAWVDARVRPHLPARMKGAGLIGLNAPLRLYRYREGQHFGLHHDQSYEGPGGSRSHLTFMLYVNETEGLEGGETEFPEERLTFAPVTGRAVIFQHAVLHEGRPVIRGTKLVLRTDVLFDSAASST